MIGFFIDHLRLKHRILLSGLLAGGLAIAIIAVAVLSFNRTAGDFVQFVEFSRQSQVDLLTTAKISEIQHQAGIYTYQGYRSAAEQVEVLHGELLSQIEQAMQQNDPEISNIVRVIKARLQNYFRAFQQVRVQRERREQLINVDFRNYANEAEFLVTELIGLPSRESASDAELHRLLSTLLLVEKHAFRYFDSLDAEHIEVARASLDEARTGLRRLEAEAFDGDRYLEVDRKLGLYLKGFIEAVQRTRGYLYLVNVVMAADAYEILYQSRKLSEVLTARMEQRVWSSLASIDAAKITLLLAAGLLLLLLTPLSYVIGQSITRPVSRLAETFRRLGQGDSDTEIPVYPIADELGELTVAARAFSDKNRETEQLLQRSRELGQALERSKVDLERSNDELEQFVYTVSHDLKSPLVTSMGFIGIIRSLSQQGRHEEAVAKLDKVVKSNERMGQLINDLLELSRVGRVDLDKKTIDLNELLERFARSQQERLSKRNFTLTIEPGLPTVQANESRLLQLFENILSNAVKYVVNADGPRLKIGAARADNQLLVFCEDNGPGIAPEYQEKVFGLFYRLDNRREGTGIGLAVAKKVMKFHGGDIWVESQPGEGATFWIRFPETKGEGNLQ
jgi:signal transduction histidine kinase